MIRLLQYLIFGHVHEWETVSETVLKDRTSDGGYGPVGQIKMLKCKNCGDWKCRKLVP